MPSRNPSSSLFGEPESPSAGSKSTGWINAHCDGGARGNPGPAGYGAQIVDGSGAVIAELSEFLGFKTNNFAEYSGLLGCLSYALEHGYSHLRVVSDSELMVKQIQGKYQVKSPDLKPLFEEAKRRIAKLDGFQITHALRHKNKEADRLANEAMDRGMKRPPAAPPVIARATPYPQKAEAAPSKADAMLRGFTRDGVVHILGDARLPDGIFVKIIRE
jgi:probable phosphoglycerate mutase